MEYNKLVSVTGLGGLFELVSSKADGGVVRSLEDKSTKFVSSRMHSFSHLEGIEVFTVKENVNLVEVFAAMGASSETLPDAKADGAVLRSYFEKVYPDMDFERVYSSDMKKMVRWFDILQKNKVDIKLSETVAADDASEQSADKKQGNKPVQQKGTSVRTAPPKKINAPRKMA